MKKLWRRILTVPLTMFIVSLVVFICLSFSSGDSSSFILSEDSGEAEVAAYREAIGLDRPFPERYVGFMASFISFDWGYTAGGQKITEVIATRLPVTFSVSILALVISLLIAVPLSYITIRKGTVRSCIATAYAVLVSSSPVFIIAIFLVIVFAAKLDLFPVAGYVPISSSFLLHLGSIFLPALSLALIHSSLFLLMFRKTLRDNMEKSFSRTYYSLGMKRYDVAIKSATKPSLPILIMLTGESVASFLGGSAAVETIFAIPGLGSLMVEGALSRDVNLAGIMMILVALLVSLSSLSAEIVSLLLDPRNRRHG